MVPIYQCTLRAAAHRRATSGDRSRLLRRSSASSAVAASTVTLLPGAALPHVAFWQSGKRMARRPGGFLLTEA